ncbi:MAG TPA: S9 family peptidase [Chitinophagaceae bacterium]|nr:S9 family peptidase [Chitinophagaceae bacterium]
MRHISLTVIFFFALKVSAQTRQPVLVTDMLKIKTISSVTLTEDGRKAALVVTSIEPESDSAKWEYKYTTQLWMISTESGAIPVQLTFSKEGASQPAWNPDGTRLAFVRTVEGRPQIFVLSLSGGEALQLTKFKYGASLPRWSPDGKQIAFAASLRPRDLMSDSIINPGKKVPVWSMEKPGFNKNEQLRSSTAKPNPNGNINEVRAYLEMNTNDRKATVLNNLNFQNETDISAEINFNHFFIIDAQPNALPVAVTRGFYRFNNLQFTPDGKQFIFNADIDSIEHPDRSQESEIFIANRDGSNLKMLLGKKGIIYNNVLLSNDGKWIAFQYSKTNYVSVPTLALMPVSGTEKDIINIQFDRNVGNAVWSKDDQSIYFTAQSNGGAPLYKLDVKSKQIKQLTDFSSGVLSFDVINDKLIYVKTEVINPNELYLADANVINSNKLTSFNDGWLKQKQISLPEKHTFTNTLGQPIEFWVMKPIGYQADKKYPLLLEIHGGPSAMWGPGELSMWHEYQYFCGKGYGVVYCNPRGSGGYGENFLRSNIRDWGAGPASDVLTSLDRAVAEGRVDTSKLMVTGGSYAGYLVAWIIGHDKRFKAACSQRGVYDLSTFFGEGNAWRLVPNYFGGYPWEAEAKAILQRESPITYVQNITTPYIIFHGDNDRRTGFVEGEMLYRSLKVLGRPVEYVRHPNASHEITRSGNNRQRIDQMLRTWEFFERWINPAF